MELRATVSRYGDLIVAAALGLLLAAESVPYGSGPAGPSVALATGAALALRRRLPVVSFLCVLGGIYALLALVPGMDGNSGAFIVIFFMAHYSLGRWASGTEAWAGALAVLVSMVAFAIGDARQNGMGPEEFTAGNILFAVGFVAGPWAAGLAIRLRRERESALDQENDRLRVEQEERAARAVAEERSRIARELHDVVSHAISVTVLQARGARRTLDTDPAAARTALDAIEQTNTAALGDMRRLLAVLRDTEPDGRDDAHAPQPSLAHLDALVDQVRAAGVPVTLEVTGDDQDVPPGVDLSAYRIVQEALTNVLKHADASPTRIALDYAEDALTVTVVDHGNPRPAAATGEAGHGLIGIRERVAVVGGDVEAGPDRGGGFRVRARLPYALEDS